MSNNTALILVVCAVGIFYFYTKMEDLHRAYIMEHRELMEVREVVKELVDYKNDISQTFEVLNKEMTKINEHLMSNTNVVPQQTVQSERSTNTILDNIFRSFGAARTPSVSTTPMLCVASYSTGNPNTTNPNPNVGNPDTTNPNTHNPNSVENEVQPPSNSTIDLNLVNSVPTNYTQYQLENDQ